MLVLVFFNLLVLRASLNLDILKDMIKYAVQ